MNYGGVLSTSDKAANDLRGLDLFRLDKKNVQWYSTQLSSNKYQ